MLGIGYEGESKAMAGGKQEKALTGTITVMNAHLELERLIIMARLSRRPTLGGKDHLSSLEQWVS